jgi:hypothetical protein
MRTKLLALPFCVVLASPAPSPAQVDEQRAQIYFQEAAALCERDGGRIWGVLLCGPMVFADPLTKTIATNQPVPPGDRPAALGFANAAIDWAGTRWSTFIWQGIPANNPSRRAQLILHELFHRVQPELGLMVGGEQNVHLDTLEGRYWLRLEWRALTQALRRSGRDRIAAIGDALAFRAARRTAFPEAAERERVLEIREGLAQYTGIAASAASPAEATASALERLTEAEAVQPTFVSTFAYTSGVGYGILLDALSPGWPRRVRGTSDLGQMLMIAAGVQLASDAAAAARRYGAAELRIAEEERDVEQKARVAELRRRFVEGPVLGVPRGRSASLMTTGSTPIPGAGIVYQSYRVTYEWGSLEATSGLLVSTDGATLTVPAPANAEGSSLKGDGWTLTIAPGWTARPGPRAGDLHVVRNNP